MREMRSFTQKALAGDKLVGDIDREDPEEKKPGASRRERRDTPLRAQSDR